MVSYSRQYLALVKVVSALLYAYDPEGHGISVGSPDDEYDELAARLISDLSKIEGRNEQIQAFQSKCAAAPDSLSEAVVAVMQLYADAKTAHPIKTHDPASSPQN